MNLAPHPFSLRQLQYAVAVADSLNFRKAAELCHVSQPSLSAQLARVESALGTRLFERDRRHVLVATPGRKLLERARRVLSEADDLFAEARLAGDPLAGTLRIGVIPTISPYLLPGAIPALRAAYPRLTPIWVEEKTEVLVSKLRAGDLDTALLALEAEIGDVGREIVAVDPFVLATRAGDPLGTGPSAVKPAEIRGQDVLLLDDGHCFREQALEYCSRAKARELAFRATSLSTLAQMVAGGAGVTLLPRLAVATEAQRAGLCIRPFAKPFPRRTIALVWRKRSPLAEALKDLAATIRSAYPRAGGQERHGGPLSYPAPPRRRKGVRGSARAASSRDTPTSPSPEAHSAYHG
jgi:LysR family hydrogen peroxide-inducible transcriptional activator